MVAATGCVANTGGCHNLKFESRLGRVISLIATVRLYPTCYRRILQC